MFNRQTLTDEKSNFWEKFNFDNYIARKNNIEFQLNNYFKENYLLKKIDPLLYWKEDLEKYFILKEFVRKYLL